MAIKIKEALLLLIRQGLVRTFILNLVLAFIYFLLAKLGLALASINNSVSPVWPATGFAFAVIYFYGNRVFFAIALGAFVANLLPGSSPLTALFISCGNSVEGLIGAIIIRKVFLYKNKLGFQADTMAFAAASVFASIFSSSIGVLTLYYSGALSKGLITSVWVTWWIGDSLGGLVISPIFIQFRKLHFNLENWANAIGALGVCAFSSYFVFFSGVGGSYLFVLFPVLLYTFHKSGSYFTICLSGFVCLIGVVATVYGKGPFAIGSFNERLVHLQFFLASYAITALALSSYGRVNLTRTPSLLALGCWALAGTVFYSFDNSEALRTKAKFENLIEDAQEKIQSLATIYEEVLRGGVGLFSASRSVEYNEWKAYTKVLNIREHHVGMNGLGVIWPVKRKDIDMFQREMKRQIHSKFEIKRVPGFEAADGGNENLRYIIKFIEPLEANLAAFGLDVGSEPNRRNAAELSRDTGAGVLAEKIVLVQDKKKTAGSLFYLPIYKNGANLTTVEARRDAFMGWVYSPIIYKNFFSEILRQASHEIELQVFEGSEVVLSNLIFSNFSKDLRLNKFTQATQIKLGQKNFTLQWVKSPHFVSSHNTVVAWVGFCGAIATLLLTHLVIVMQMVGTRSREIANELTKELSDSREKFKQGERRLLYALDGSNDGIWDWNITLGEMYVKGKIAETHGWPQNHHVQSAKDLISYAHPDDLESIDRSIYKVLKGTSSSHEVETRYRTVEGTWRWVLTRGKVSELDAEGRPARMTGVHIDIHELKNTQHSLERTQYRLANIANSVPTKISFWSSFLKCEFANDLFARWFNLTANQLVGKYMTDIIGGEDFVERLPIDQKALDEEHYRYEREAIRPFDGQKRHIVVTFLPSQSDGAAGGFFLFIQDITDLKQAELRAIEEKRVAVEATKVKSQFLANMSHEIRTPLNGIIGMTKLLKGITSNTKQNEYLEVISRSSNALLNLINDILDFSKVEAGKLELEIVDFSLKDLVSDILNVMSFAAKEKNLYLESDLDIGSKEYFKGDPGRIRQILTNLIGNGIKFTEKGGVKLRVNGIEGSTTSSFKFEVIDTGIGLSEGSESRLFEAFSQADISTTRKFGGTGLGLSICKNLVQLMDGEIGVDSAPGKGSNFWFCFDLAHGSVFAKDEQSLEIERTKAARILVVEDNQVNQQIALGLLENLGYAPHAVGDGLEALDAIKSAKYDLILMDCQMPEMDGFEATKAIRRSEDLNLRSLPIVAMTANAFAEDEEKCMAVGMDGYVTKPIDERKLVMSIEKCLKKPQQLGEKGLLAPIDTDFIKKEGAAKKQKNESSVIDRGIIENLRKLQRPDSPDLLTRLIDLFFESAHESMVQLRAAKQVMDLATLSAASHSLKSSAANLGAAGFSAICFELEKLGRGQLPVDQLDDLLFQLEVEYASVLLELEGFKRAA